MSDKEPQINMGPLLDVVFILLLFFMVSTSFINERALPLERPKSSTAVALPAQAVRLYISSEGSLLLNSQPVSRFVLPQKLRELQTGHPGSTMLLVSDKKLPSGELIAIADICRTAGFTKIAVATEEP